MTDKKTDSELQLLKRIAQLLEVLVRRSVQPDLTGVLSDKRLRQLYRLTGDATVRELAAKTGISRSTISSIWQTWEHAGLIFKDGQGFKKVVQ